MIVFYNAWVLLSLALFYRGPIQWDGARSADVGLYVLLCLVSFDVAYLLARRRTHATSTFAGARWAPRSTRGARALILGYAVLTVIYLYSTTGRNVLSPSAYSLDFGAVYADYGANLSTRTASQAVQVVTLLKAVVFPFALVTFFDRFRRDKVVVVGFLAPMAVSSIFRGTDKEVLDILLLLLVAMFCYRLLTWKSVATLALVPLAGALFVTRRLGRFDGSLPTCLPESSACFDYGSQVAQALGARAEIFSVFGTNYLTNGYQGLAYAFSLPWTPNFGLGHLPPVKRVLCSASETLCSTADYQSALTTFGWDTSARWTTAFPVLANDLSFWLVPLYTAFLGIVLARCLAGWRSGRDPRAAAGILLVTMFWVYSSANMQIAISLDWALATVALLYVSPLRKLRRQAADGR
ncbi:hypothetical protein [Arthrobacter sp. NEB 688]|uniref:hypothetical protein n=1 Tax=Arthrobacter sp. NEB 688 TaxID=904039 RepID=UPI001563ED73|nr:hypothetical protein [Arthrobacter sp. NEB 688]QKE85633.1 hypothetical protein HL663_18030 [Arthrobacter sp. NEB 688]